MKPDEDDRAKLIANASYFRAVVFRGRGMYDSGQAPTLEGAREQAQKLYLDRPVSIYVVAMDDGIERSHHVENWAPLVKRGRYKRRHT